MLGEMTVADLLGSYEHNLDERDRLFRELAAASGPDGEVDTERSRELFKLWQRTEQRLWLYRLILNETEPLP